MKPVYFSYDDLLEPEEPIIPKDLLDREFEFTQFIKQMETTEQEDEFIDTKTEEMPIQIQDLPPFPEQPL